MDIMPAFEAVVPGSNPGGSTRRKKPSYGLFSALGLGAAKLFPAFRKREGALLWFSVSVESKCGYGSMVEHLVANQMMGVRFSLPAH